MQVRVVPSHRTCVHSLELTQSTEALDFRQWIGGEAKIFDYCHNLALQGGKRMAEIMGTREMDPDGNFTLNMVCR